jgi:hypothetical protein
MSAGKTGHTHEHQDDFLPVAEADNRRPPLPRGERFFKYPLRGRLFRFLAWWLIFTGIYASSSVCPFCGRAGCPVGGFSAGMVGGFFALLIEKGKVFLNYLADWIAPLRSKLHFKSRA